jgi:hypothetical protein
VFSFCTALAVAGPVRAQTVLSPVSVTSANFIYGNLSFAITSCSFTLMGAATSCGSDSTVIETVSNGRGGTEIEVVPTPGSYAQTAGQTNTTLSFNVTVSDLSASRGISSITNILTATAGSPTDNSLISAALTGPGSAVSNAGTLTTSTSFALTHNPVNFNVSINLASSGAHSTLTFSNVKFLFQPAPEPASIAVFMTGLGGLAAVRRRMARRSRAKPAVSP